MVLKPKVVVEYNAHMGGVDKADQTHVILLLHTQDGEVVATGIRPLAGVRDCERIHPVHGIQAVNMEVEPQQLPYRAGEGFARPVWDGGGRWW